MNIFKVDLKRYLPIDERPSWGNVLDAFFYEESLWFIFAFRLGQWVRKKHIPFLSIPTRILHRVMSLVTGIEIPLETRVGPGLYIGHGGKIVVNSETVIGAYCNLSTGVVIGVSGRGIKRGVPSIGDCVYIAPGAKIFGPVIIGNGVVIGANAVVATDIEENAVLGAPLAVAISHKGSRDYIQGFQEHA